MQCAFFELVSFPLFSCRTSFPLNVAVVIVAGTAGGTAFVRAGQRTPFGFRLQCCRQGEEAVRLPSLLLLGNTTSTTKSEAGAKTVNLDRRGCRIDPTCQGLPADA
jgi:ABC-type branched-subunit amino acid transport system permease subunit